MKAEQAKKVADQALEQLGQALAAGVGHPESA